MQQPPEPSPAQLLERLRTTPGLAVLVAEAEATWRQRGREARSDGAAGSDPGDGTDEGKPAWRSFEDAFPTFYEFTNRPR